MQETITIRAFFVNYHAGEKNGRPYYMLSLSNGLRTATSFLDKAIDVEGLKEGDEIEVEMTATINFKNAWDIVPVALSKV